MNILMTVFEATVLIAIVGTLLALVAYEIHDGLVDAARTRLSFAPARTDVAAAPTKLLSSGKALPASMPVAAQADAMPLSKAA
ncbi:MAG: hypothetical protein V4650_03710 [Pseudomonadota bacterium]